MIFMKFRRNTMSRKKGVVFSAEQKAKIVLELLKEDQTIAELVHQFKRFHSIIGYRRPINYYIEMIKKAA